MFLAALLDLGDPRFALEDLRELAEALVPGESEIELSRAERGSIAASLLDVRTPESEEPPHRHLAECLERIAAAPLSAAAQARAGAIFRRIAEAEGRVHGIDPRRGALPRGRRGRRADRHLRRGAGARAPRRAARARDAAAGRLGDRALRPRRDAGARARDGRDPARPASTASAASGERLTPTGAAILAELAEDCDYRGSFAASRTATAPATATRAGPAERRARAARTRRDRSGADVGVAVKRAEVLELAVNLDDMTGEEIGHLVGRLRAAGRARGLDRGRADEEGPAGRDASARCAGPPTRRALERAAFAALEHARPALEPRASAPSASAR